MGTPSKGRGRSPSKRDRVRDPFSGRTFGAEDRRPARPPRRLGGGRVKLMNAAASGLSCQTPTRGADAHLLDCEFGTSSPSHMDSTDRISPSRPLKGDEHLLEGRPDRRLCLLSPKASRAPDPNSSGGAEATVIRCLRLNDRRMWGHLAGVVAPRGPEGFLRARFLVLTRTKASKSNAQGNGWLQKGKHAPGIC